MRVLLDTHVLLWWLLDDLRLSQLHRGLILDGDAQINVSSIGIAETSIKQSIGRLDVPDFYLDVMKSQGIEVAPFTVLHAAALEQLPWHHRDPFDRMLVAQARAEGMVLASGDRNIHRYPIDAR